MTDVLGSDSPLSKFDVAVVMQDGASLFSAEQEQFDLGSIGEKGFQQLMKLVIICDCYVCLLFLLCISLPI